MCAARTTPRTAITVGNFDGAHVGHRALVNRARELVGPEGRVIVLSFDPHPVTVLRPDAVPPARITSFDDRARLLRDCGASEVVRLEPTHGLLQKSPGEFVRMLFEQYRMDTIVEGPDFRFGRDRTGDIDTLRALGNQHGFEGVEVPSVNVALSDDLVVTASSTVARWLLRHGRINDVKRLFDRPYTITSRVVRGDARGRTIGFPTANLLPEVALPAAGVYAGLATIEDGDSSSKGQTYHAAINIGIRPTFHTDTDPVCEVHLIDYDGKVGSYGWTLCVEFHAFLRDELRFAGKDELTAQIGRDINAVRTLVNGRRPGVATAETATRS